MSIAYKDNKAVKVFLIFGKIYGYYYPHFVVHYNGLTAKIAIDRSILEGILPSDITNFILAWAKNNYLDLEDKWNQLMDKKIASYRSAA
ncbi:MAG: DUF4160 domain-containing protein [Ignavibacteria bacterium]|nr:DUF4160 domain-containing protein [Ignavibacteria bacterium]